MNTKRLGSSDVAVSDIILGTWSMGGDYFGEADDRESAKVIRTYLDNGINTFDTAEVYGKGRAETVLGNTLEGVDRESYTLISKVFPHHYAMADMEKSCDDSLKRLKTDYLDTYFLHYPPRDMSIGQAMENIMALKEKGKIRSIGVSNFTLDMLKEARSYGPVDVVQPCYNLLWRYIDRDLLPYCCQEGISVIPYSTLAQGLLTGHFKKDTPVTAGRQQAALFQPENYERCLEVTAELEKIGKKYDKSPAQVCINWMIRNPALTAPIIGGTDDRHARQNLEAMNFCLSDEDYNTIDSVSKDFCSRLPEYVLFFDSKIRE